MPKGKKTALKAMRKPAAFGPDLNLAGFRRKARPWPACPISALPKEVTQKALEAGVKADEKGRAGMYFQVDYSVVLQTIRKTFEGKVDVMSTPEALEKYGWVKDYWWKIVDVSTDKYTALAELKWDKGVFIRVRKGQKVTLPLQACFFISKDGLNQNVHNLIVAEPHSEVQLITGCTTHRGVQSGLHVGVSEFYVGEGAKLTFTMVHNWAPNFDARPRAAALLEKDATFVSNYVCLRPVKSLQMYPVAYCRGANSRVSFNTILYGAKNSYLDVGSKVVLQGKGSRGEVIARAIASDNAQINARGLLVGEHEDSRAHLECRGLLLSDEAAIHAIPELLGKVEGTELSHEAAVGKIAEEQIQYLMARGFSESEAESLIIRGFMDVGIFGLPDALRDEIKRMIETTVVRAL
ncbi:MAG: SufD family Fe-S cluster assembly protein [Candidatus Hodarchaeaceae archaeon]|nr:SufD family Fe-S cluster assembly protein [Candidatus Hodarchaeaceae archaeon]